METFDFTDQARKTKFFSKLNNAEKSLTIKDNDTVVTEQGEVLYSVLRKGLRNKKNKNL